MAIAQLYTLPAKINKAQLFTELEVIGVNVAFVIPACTQTNSDGEVIEIPAHVEVVLPHGVSEAAAAAVLAAHAPAQSDEEIEEAEAEQRGAASRAVLRASLVEFLQDPELLAMLKAALQD